MTDRTGNRRIALIVLVLGLVFGMGLLIVLCGVGFWFTARQQARAAAEREVAEAHMMQAHLGECIPCLARSGLMPGSSMRPRPAAIHRLMTSKALDDYAKVVEQLRPMLP